MTDLPIAGQTYQVIYRLRIGGTLTDLPTGGTVDRITLKQGAVEVLVILGPATRTSVGTYEFPAATMPAAGDYTTETLYRTSVGGPDKLDINDTLRVYDFDGVIAGAAYATGPDLATWTGSAAPADADRLLLRASELIDEALFSACYRIDDNNNATDAQVISALRDATCAQVEFWLSSDEEEDILGPTQGVVLGNLQLQYGAGANRITPAYLAPRAWRILRNCAWIVW